MSEIQCKILETGQIYLEQFKDNLTWRKSAVEFVPWNYSLKGETQMIVSMCIFLKIAKISDLIIVKLSHVECSGITLNTAKMSFLLHLLLLKKIKIKKRQPYSGA